MVTKKISIPSNVWFVKKTENGECFDINQKGFEVLQEVYELMENIYYFNKNEKEEIFEINV